MYQNKKGKNSLINLMINMKCNDHLNIKIDLTDKIFFSFHFSNYSPFTQKLLLYKNGLKL